MAREKVEFAANVKTQVILDGDGTLQTSKSGEDEYRYFLRGDKIMWVPPEVHQAIQQAGAGSGCTVTIERAKTAKAPAVWYVEETSPANYGRGYSNRPSPTTAPPERRAAAAPRPTANQRGASDWQQPAAAQDDEEPPTNEDRMAQAMRDAIELWRGASEMEPSLKWSAGDVRALAATLFIEGGKRTEGGKR